MAYTGMLRPKGVPFSGFRYAKGVGISQVEVYKSTDTLITVINTLSHAVGVRFFFSRDREREIGLVFCQSLIEDLTEFELNLS